jgi:head-tail adaptor
MLLTSYKVVPAVYRLRAVAGVDSYGDPVESWTTPERVRLKGATVQDVRTEEVEGSTRTIVRGEKALFVPGAVDLTEDDRIEVSGEVWRVNGPPTVRRGLGSATFTTATLTRTT